MKTDRTKILVAALMFILALAVPAFAHGQTFTGSSGFLLFQPDIRKELELTPEQADKVQKAIRDYTEDLGDGRMVIRMTPGMDMAEIDNSLLGPLKPEQKKRLRELWIQFSKGKILAEESIQKELDLTAKQKSEVEDVRAWYRDEIQAMAMESGGGVITISEELEKKASDKYLAILTADQKKKLDELKGKPYEFKKRKKG